MTLAAAAKPASTTDVVRTVMVTVMICVVLAPSSSATLTASFSMLPARRAVPG